MINPQVKVWAVHMYPGGAVICHKVHPRDVMFLHEALKELHEGRPICVALEHLFLIRYVKRQPTKRTTLVGRELARLMLDREEATP